MSKLTKVIETIETFEKNISIIN
ncbi:hypothetical protein CY0110_17012 [Crocosphaera chwakensis CCY0110]|uniref:Uncharacterized protein n=1 Tax=Crocosphaera chwakensis CCY0110 TaxID=391612 RepID=A3II84_9CHRO|nr:hypothetical protein CY0110_17012 [Crocosphaera chwakensis CCY0110]